MDNPPTPPQEPEEDYGEIIHQMEMPEELKSDGSPESLAKMAEVRAQLDDPSSELGSLFAETAATPRTSKD